MSFKSKVEQIEDISRCLEDGLHALRRNRSKVILTDSRKCNGSIDLDTCLQIKYPNEPRWDYIIGYNEKAYFAEVHPVSGHVSDILSKVTWLRNWLKKEGSPLAEIHEDANFHWIPTSGVRLIGKHRRLLAQNKIVIKARLRLL